MKNKKEEKDVYKYNYHWQLTPTWSQWIKVEHKDER